MLLCRVRIMVYVWYTYNGVSMVYVWCRHDVRIVDWGGFGHGVNSDSIRNVGAI